jgi:hypothetical protein
MENANFDTDLTDEQWQAIEPYLPAAKSTGRPRTPLRRVFNAILYVVTTGCQWRLLPKTFPPFKTVFHIFQDWKRRHIWSALNDRLRALVREAEDRRSRPTVAILDSQTVRSSAHGGPVGYDAGKKTKGRKRFLLVDTLGMVLGAIVQPANQPERAGAMALLEPLLPWFPWLRKIWVDGGYTGEDFRRWVGRCRPNVDVEVVKRSEKTTGFHLLKRRWIVERTFAWLMQHRRLVRDHERTESSATAWIYIAMIRVMLRRIA